MKTITASAVSAQPSGLVIVTSRTLEVGEDELGQRARQGQWIISHG